MKSRFNGTCIKCRQNFTAGTEIDFEKGRGAWHSPSCETEPVEIDFYDLAASLGFVSWEQSQMKVWTKDNVVQMDLFRQAQ